jgi:hypothetical protein
MGDFLATFGIWIFLGLFVLLMLRGGGCGMGHGSGHHGHHDGNQPEDGDQENPGSNHQSGGCH